MSIGIVGGHDRMVRQYKEICKNIAVARSFHPDGRRYEGSPGKAGSDGSF